MVVFVKFGDESCTSEIFTASIVANKNAAKEKCIFDSYFSFHIF